MQILSSTRRAAAVTFLREQGRPLDYALYRFEFESGDLGAVLDELAAYRNDDGGYGHALEPDAVVSASSVLDTTHALQVLRRIRATRDEPQVRDAMRFLRESFNREHGVWPIRPFASAGVVCAPWWKAEDAAQWAARMAEGRLNPTAEVLGYLIEYAADADAARADEVAGRVRRWVDEAASPMDGHDLLCLARLTRTAGIDEQWRDELVARVRGDVALRIEEDPAKWDGYGLKPWWIGETPDDSVLGGVEPALVEAMLDHEIGRQEDDGGWPPFWDWGGLHPEAWPAARQAWKSVLTEHMLRVLRDFGRLAD
ncbi:MAG: hypothetical protein AAF333_08635 [Planctomycetota bacterium]